MNSLWIWTGATSLFTVAIYKYYKNGRIAKHVQNLTEQAINKYVELKWCLLDEKTKIAEAGGTADGTEEENFPVIDNQKHYIIYADRDAYYITFKTEPPRSYICDAPDIISDIIVVKNPTDSTDPTDPTSLLRKYITMCMGPSGNFDDGIPSIDQLKTIPELIQILKDVEKIIVNTDDMQEYIIR